MTQTSLRMHMVLLRNMWLCARRSPVSVQSTAGRVAQLVGFLLLAIYFIAVGTVLGLTATGGRYGIVFAFIPLMLSFDFMLRLGLQQTPAVVVKPYMLLPVKRADVVDCFLLRSLVGTVTGLWTCLFLPCAIVCFCGGLDFLMSVLLFLVGMFLVVVNSQWYLWVRTLACRHTAYWLVPFVVYGVADALLLVALDANIQKVMDFCADYCLAPVAVIVYVAVSAVLFAANRTALLRGAAAEVAGDEGAAVGRRLHLGALEQLGCIGEYLKLEVRSAIRNKTVRQRYVSGFISVSLLSFMTAFTDAYDGDVMRNIWCLYCFVLFGALNLVRVMGVEGNYIDLLMTQRENLFQLLRAKYYFYCAVLLLPLLLLTPAIVAGKYPPLMIVAYILTTTGTEYFLLFQLAVYNKQAQPLTQSVTGKDNADTGLQLTVNLTAFFFPVLLALTLSWLFGTDVAYGVMCVLGLAFTLTHNLWLRNVYDRMMRRKYANLDGFHSTMVH